MTEINWDEQTLPFRCYDCGHQSTTKSEAYEHNEVCPSNNKNKNKKLGN
jgi:DNA-directed RNA polymerase subunit N (RpoN/RPB10)